jgi:hypothetical protein
VFGESSLSAVESAHIWFMEDGSRYAHFALRRAMLPADPAALGTMSRSLLPEVLNPMEPVTYYVGIFIGHSPDRFGVDRFRLALMFRPGAATGVGFSSVGPVDGPVWAPPPWQGDLISLLLPSDMHTEALAAGPRGDLASRGPNPVTVVTTDQLAELGELDLEGIRIVVMDPHDATSPLNALLFSENVAAFHRLLQLQAIVFVMGVEDLCPGPTSTPPAPSRR